MTNRTTTLLAVFAVFAAGVLLLVNVKQLLPGGQNQPYLQSDNIKSIVIVAGENQFPLDNEEQKVFVKYINRSAPVDKIREVGKKEQPNFSKIVIDRVKDPATEITPIIWVDGGLVYSAPQWHAEGYMIVFTDGYLKGLIDRAMEKSGS